MICIQRDILVVKKGERSKKIDKIINLFGQLQEAILALAILKNKEKQQQQEQLHFVLYMDSFKSYKITHNNNLGNQIWSLSWAQIHGNGVMFRKANCEYKSVKK